MSDYTVTKVPDNRKAASSTLTPLHTQWLQHGSALLSCARSPLNKISPDQMVEKKHCHHKARRRKFRLYQN